MASVEGISERSKVVAQNMGTVDAYELGVLLEDESWALFRRLAIKEGQEERSPNLSSIGREIVKKCGNLPLAIRTMGGLLRSKDTQQEWEYIKDSDFRRIEPDGNIIMSTLKLSYDHLPSHIKQCFAYCSLFPKDHRFEKEYLIHLWTAQGFIGSSNRNQTLEDVGHGCFMELLRRSFFQEVETTKNNDDTIRSCKMHDLVHDLALAVAGGETLLIDRCTQKINNDILHVSIPDRFSREVPSSLLAGKKCLRSLIVAKDLIYIPYDLNINMHEALSSLKQVRALSLGGLICESLPNSIGELKHLRYLKLGGSLLQSLPECITRLRYLQTLDLRLCFKLRQLPSSLSNLNSLRRLYFEEDKLVDLPARFGHLTSLWELNEFIVGENNGLDALTTLKNLGGRLSIRIVKLRENVACEVGTGILKVTNLTELQLKSYTTFTRASDHGDQEEKEWAYLECLHPPPFLKRLTVTCWSITSFPSRGMYGELQRSLPNLVYVKFDKCWRCKKLPPFSRLPHLRYLILEYLGALECVEIGGGGNDNEAAPPPPYFPSLEKLYLKYLPMLKGWSKMEGQDDDDNTTRQRHHQNSVLFPRLLELYMEQCPELLSMPLAPKLVRLEAKSVHGKVVKHVLCGDDDDDDDDDDQEHSHSPSDTLTHLRMEEVHELDSLSVQLSSLLSLDIWNCRDLIDLRLESPTPLSKLVIVGCERLRGDATCLRQHASALEYLSISECGEWDWGDVSNDGDDDDDDEAESSSSSSSAAASMTRVRTLGLDAIPRLPRGLVCLPALEELHISRMLNLRALPEGIGRLTALQCLVISGIPKLTALPEGIGRLSHLCLLMICRCPELRALPKPMRNLVALQQLDIISCPEIERRCQEPNGEDCPLIRHIPLVKFGW